ncbi:MAG: PEP-CTERM sorting domain-containing protein [Myxococcota bacterium]
MSEDVASPRSQRTIAAHLLFGVLFPLFALGFEVFTYSSGSIYFDPIPSWWHLALVGAVPIANAWLLRVWRDGSEEHVARACAASSFTLVVAWFYTLLYLPILPFSILAILFLGMGLLPYAPLFGLLSNWRLRRRLRRERPELEPAFRRRTPVFAAIALIALLELPGWVAQTGFVLAESHEPTRQRLGVQLLRGLGSEDALLRVLHFGRGQANLTGHWIFGDNWLRHASLNPLDRDAKAFYRASGIPPETTEPPGRPLGTREDFLFSGGERFDRTTTVVLETSELTARVIPEAQLVYVEWTWVLRNRFGFDAEARTVVELPPGAALTRATLWVRGEPREAAFGSTEGVTAAYEAVTARRLDPLLVTDAGKDRVAVRCFPVPAKGDMRVRLGMTVPLALVGSSAEWRLPTLVEPDFGVPEHLEKDVLLRAPKTLVGDFSGWEDAPGDLGFGKRRGFTHATEAWVRWERDPELVYWGADPHDPRGLAIEQRFEPSRFVADRLLVVIDASKRLAPHADTIADTLATLPETTDLGIVIASEPPLWLLEPGGSRELAIQTLRRFPFAGGHDNAPALALALEALEGARAPSLFWVHAPVSTELSLAVTLQSRLAALGDRLRIGVLATEPGADALAKRLHARTNLAIAPRRGALGSDLSRALGHMTGEAAELRATRTRLRAPAEVAIGPAGTAASEHVARLWARDTALARSRSGNTADATALAVRDRVVTPVSGAVVLETDTQYEENDLDAPAEGADDALVEGAAPMFPAQGAGPIGSIPEPGTGSLTAFGLTLLAAWRRRRRARVAQRAA